jgi:hypothetical protein
MLTSPKPVLPAANTDYFSPSKLHTALGLRRRYSPLSIQTILPGSRQRWTKAVDRVRRQHTSKDGPQTLITWPDETFDIQERLAVIITSGGFVRRAGQDATGRREDIHKTYLK